MNATAPIPASSSISFVIATANDGWCGDSLGRLKASVRCLAQGALGRPETQIVIVDWASKEPIHERIDETQHFPCACRHVYIPREIASRWNIPFVESVALNAGVRLSSGKLICRLDQDTLVGPAASTELLGLAGTDCEHGHAYFSGRRDMPAGLDTIDPSAPINPDNCQDNDNFFRGAVGVLAASAQTWTTVRGYDESMIHRLHIEHDLCERFRNYRGLADIGPATDFDFYHQWHDRGPGLARPANPAPSQREIRARLEGAYAANPSGWGLERDQDRLMVIDRVMSNAPCRT